MDRGASKCWFVVGRLRSLIAAFFVLAGVLTFPQEVRATSYEVAGSQCQASVATRQAGDPTGRYGCEVAPRGTTGLYAWWLWSETANGGWVRKNIDFFPFDGGPPPQCTAGEFVAGTWTQDGATSACRGGCETTPTIQIGGSNPTFGTVTTGNICPAGSSPEAPPPTPKPPGYTPDDPNDPSKGGTYCTSSPTVCVHGDAPNTGGDGGNTGGGGDTGGGNTGGGDSGGGNTGGDGGSGNTGGGDGGGDTGGGNTGGGNTGGGNTGGGNTGGGNTGGGDSGGGNTGGGNTGGGDTGSDGGDGDGGDGGGKGSYSGDGCDVPPQCSGDAVMCGVAVEAHRTRCAAEKALVGTKDAPESGKHDVSEITKASVISLGDKTDQSGLGLGDQCVRNSTIEYAGTVVGIDFSDWCAKAPYMRIVLMILATMTCGAILAGNSRSL